MDGTNMPGQAYFTPSDHEQYFGSVSDATADLAAAYGILRQGPFTLAKVSAVGQQINAVCTALQAMDAEARDRLGLPEWQDSGGTGKPVQA